MKQSASSPAIKAIVIMGGFALALLLLSALGLKSMVNSAQANRVVVPRAQSAFDGRRAYDDLRTIVGFGPRPSGSDALVQLQNHIEQSLTAAGLQVRREEFDASTPIGVLHMMNIAGVVQGTEPGVIILGNHYETKYFPDFRFVGANDGGSTTAWMLEMARTLGAKRQGKTVWLCFFDGEESFGEWSAADSLYGSRAFVENLKAEGRLGEIAAMINLDMVGDCFLDFKRDRDAPAWLTQAVWNKARDLGYGQYFQPFMQSVEDDHIPFRRAGIPAMDVIDFSYGGSMADHRRNWHTPNDTIDRVCADSLQVVGDVIYHALPEIDARTKRVGPVSTTPP